MLRARLITMLALALALALSGCGDSGETAAPEVSHENTQAVEPEETPVSESDNTEESEGPGAVEQSPEVAESNPEPQDPSPEPAPEQPQEKQPQQQDVAYPTWDAAQYPDYYTVTGAAAYDPAITPGTATYLPLDRFGRATGVVACITGAQRAAARNDTRDDDDAADEDPVGWPRDNQIAVVPGITERDYKGYLWNRSHLLAHSLGGNATRENIVAGTRCMNVGQRDNRGGMAYCESRARDYLDSHPNGWLYYAVTPAYEGSEPICRGLWIDMRSDDASIDQRVFVFNAANGYQIDYTGASATGYSSTTVEAAPAEPAPQQTPAQDVSAAGPVSPSATYILNTNTGKFHLPSCSSVDQMADHNKQEFSGTRDEAIALGYDPCGRCHP